MLKEFNVVIEKDVDGYFVASITSLGGCHTQAKSLDVLMKRIQEAAELCLEFQDSQILDEKLSDEWEDKNFQIIIPETNETEVKKKRFFDFVDQHHFTLPEDYQFNREEIYER